MPQIPQRLGNWWLLETLGAGYSGSIFRAQNVHTGQIVALKVQDVNHECPTNLYERGFYPSLQGGTGMPTLWASGVERGWDFLAIDLLGPSLDGLFRKSGRDRMDLRSVCCIAIQAIKRLDFMHSRGILHRDIQLGNCVIGLPPHEKTIYMIDFGFSKRYIDPRTKRHIQDSKKKRDFIGNYWFTSVGVHCRGQVPSRRDDLEALALMLIHLLTPCGLAWTRNGVPKNDAQHERIKREKRTARPEDLCHGLPAQFEEFLRYCRRLKFMECPDYETWQEEFAELLADEGFPVSDEFVWPPPVQKVPPTPVRHTPGPGSMERILNDLAGLNLEDKQVLADRTNVAEAVRHAKQDAKKPVIEISDDSDTDSALAGLPVGRRNKAAAIVQLCRRMGSATDNLALADLVDEFAEVLKGNRSRTLTKEGFRFLDVLYKQLADPSVFIVPLRTSRTTRGGSNKGEESGVQPARVKLDALAALRRQVGMAKGNRVLAKMVADFGVLTDKSSGRTVTKDGIAFLEGVAGRLRELHS